MPPHRAWLLAILCSACTDLATDFEARVAPFELRLSDDRVVMTPGGRSTIRVRIDRSEPDPVHPVQLELAGGAPGLGATLDTANTKNDTALISFTVPPGTGETEAAFTLHGKLGKYRVDAAFTAHVGVPGPGQPGVEEYAPGVAGVVKTVVIGGVPVTYEVIDGLAIVNGDVVLGDDAALTARAGMFTGTCNPGFHTEFACGAWTDGVIGYSFAPDLDDAMRARITRAIEIWETETGIRFARRGAGEYLQFRNGGGCSSTAGRAVITGFDTQSISLNTNCSGNLPFPGGVVHEIGHAIGLYHEQSRNDRGDFVVVDFGRVQDFRLHNFFQWGEGLIDRGPYDYDSVMHYRWDAFARNAAACNTGRMMTPPDFSECTLRPTSPTTARIGQRDHLSENDILGAYSLYPPSFRITGANDFDTGYRFFLDLDYATPVPRANRIEWSSDLAGPLGTGHRLVLRAGDVPAGLHTITASFVVAGITVVSRVIHLNVQNTAPVVTLAATNGSTIQQAGQSFTVAASISDAEEGFCSGCTIAWMPAVASGPDDAAVATFLFPTPGPQTIFVLVEDHGGGRTIARLDLEIVDTAPTVEIVSPTTAIAVDDGMTLPLHGRGFDVNTSSGQLPCDALAWTSTAAGDTFTPTSDNCHVALTVHGPGPRTISLVGHDDFASSAPATLEVAVADCSAGCPPVALVELSAPDHGTNTYFIERELAISLLFGDDVPGDLGFRVTVTRAGEPDVVVATSIAMVVDPGALVPQTVRWTPATAVAPWAGCATIAEHRDYTLVLEVTGADGRVTTVTRPIRLGCDLI